MSMEKRRADRLGLMAWVGVLLVACASRDPGTMNEGEDYVGKDALVERAELRFADDTEEARFDRARACFVARGAQWRHYPLRKIGNFIEEDWCRGGTAASGCSGGSFRESLGIDWAHVGTLHVPRDWPQVFGVQIDAGHRPDDGWGVWASVATGGSTILGEGTHVSFQRGSDPSTTIHLGTGYAHVVAEETLQVFAGDPLTVFETLRVSPQSLRDEGIRRYEELQTTVVGKLTRGMIEKCVYGPYEGGGIPPECVEKVPLTEAEVATERERIETEVARVRTLLQTHHVELHAALTELLPADCV